MVTYITAVKDFVDLAWQHVAMLCEIRVADLPSSPSSLGPTEQSSAVKHETVAQESYICTTLTASYAYSHKISFALFFSLISFLV